MSDSSSISEDKCYSFLPLTQKSLTAIEGRIAEENARQVELAKKGAERKQVRCDDEDKDKGPKPNARLKEGMRIPIRVQSNFSPKFASIPIEDIDTFYRNQRTFVVISQRKFIYRFSATDALWILGPFNPIRRVAIRFLVHPVFLFSIIATILINCFFMMMPMTRTIMSIHEIFTFIYTFEMAVKVIARGFILQPFTYLRDAWNWLDFVLIIMAYVRYGLGVEILGVFQSLRLLRVLKAAATIFPGLKIICCTVIESLKNLRDLAILSMSLIFMFALLGLQIYMGVLTQKCIENFPTDGSWGNLTDENWFSFCSDQSHWYIREDAPDYMLCGNSSGSGQCPPGYTCLQGFGGNPNYGYTNFNTFGWASLSAVRLMTQDFWESLYQLVLRSSGPWQMLFFIVVILVSFSLLNLILAIVALSYDVELRKAEEEEAAEEEAIRETEAAKEAKRAKQADKEAAHERASHQVAEVVESPSVRLQDASGDSGDGAMKAKRSGNPFIEQMQQTPNVGMNDVVLNDIEQASGQKSRASEQGDEDDGGPSFIEKMLAVCLGCIDIFCVWDCCWPWLKFQQYVALLVFDPFFALFIMICIVMNTLLMALEHYDMDKDLEKSLIIGNYFFTVTYAIEALLKLIAMSPKYYFQHRWNIFDFIIVALCLLELGIGGIQNLSVLRSLRLLQVFKLARCWPTLSWLISIMGRTLGAFGKLTFVLFNIIFIFAVMGMSLFGMNYIENVERFPNEELTRWNFTDFIHSFMIVFRAMCGEWIEPMWDCMLVADWSCIPFFLAVLVIGKLIVLNLFLALLLSSFGSSNRSAPGAVNETNKIAEAFDRFSRFFKWIKCSTLNQAPDVENGEREESHLDEDEGLDLNTVDTVAKNAPNCCPNKCSKYFPFLAGGDENSPFWQWWANLRLKTFHVIQNTFFERAIITTILLNILALTLEDVNLPQRPVLQVILYYIDHVYAGIFFIEMLMKWLGLGFKKYFTNAWCTMDFVILMLSLIHLVSTWTGAFDIPIFHSMQALRALKLLRAFPNWTSMRILMNTLVAAIPGLFNVFVVCLVFWFVFAILGVQLFAGKYHKCVDDSSKTLSFEIIPDRNACIAGNYTWKNSPMNFDHVGKAYLSLLQVATFKGWIQIMNDAIDSRGLYQQPIREVNIFQYLYFVFFIIFGPFFSLNLCIGVIIDNFKEQRRKAGSLEMFMTEDQKKYYNVMMKMGSKKLQKTIPRPKWKPQAIVFEMCRNGKLEMIFMIVLGLNMLILILDHYQQSQQFSDVLDYFNLFFIAMFSLECLIKIFALRYHYFKKAWNVFDFVVVVLSLLGLVLSDVIEKYFMSPTLLRLVRVVRVRPVLRLFKGTRGIRTLLFALATSLPALFSICFLLFIITYIFAIFGMYFFMHVRDKGGLDDVYNFKTFGQSMILLFQVSTSAGWDGVLEGITNEDNCNKPDNVGYTGNCGSATIGTVFLLSYLVISFFIIINLYIAVILENYSQAKENEQEGLLDDDFDMYYETWQQFDPDGTQYIHYDQLSDFLDVLEPPLRIPKPNKYKILLMDIPICKGDRMFFADVLDALARKRNPIEESADLVEFQARPDEVGYERVSSTLSRQREEYCVRLIQNIWRKHKKQRQGGAGEDLNDAGDDADLHDRHETAVLIESDGSVAKNGHRVVIHSRLPRGTSQPTDV